MGATHEFDHGLPATLLICVVYPLGPAAIILMPMIVGGLVDGYGYSEPQAGNIAALEGLGLVAASVAAAFWIRRVSWVRALVWSCLLYAGLNVVSANVVDYSVLIGLRFLTGFAGGNVFAVTVAALGDNREPDRAFGLAQAVQGVLMLAAFAASPYLLAAWNPGALYYMLAIASLGMMLALWRFPERGVDRGATAHAAAAGNRHTLLIWLGLAASVIFFINVFGFWTFVERIGNAAGLSASTIGLALGLSQIAAIVGALAAAVMSDRFGRYLPLLLVAIGQCTALLALLGAFGSSTFFASTSAFQALFFLAVAYQMGAIAKLDIDGRYLVVMTAAQGLGAAFGPAAAGALIGDGADYGGIMRLAAACCVVSTLAFFFIIFRSRNAPVSDAVG